MSIVLDGYILPNHLTIKKNYIELSSSHTTILGKTKKDIYKIKAEYTITFDKISSGLRDDIEELYNDKTTKALVIDEENLKVNTTVHMVISDINYQNMFHQNSFEIKLLEV